MIIKMKLISLLIIFFAISNTHGASKKNTKKSKVPIGIKEIDETEGALEVLMDSYDYVAVIFYDKQNTRNSKVINKLDKLVLSSKVLTSSLSEGVLFFGKLDNDEEALAYGLQLGSLPKLILFENGIPEEYSEDEDLNDSHAVLDWIKDEIASDDIETLDVNTLEKVVDNGKAILSLFMEDESKAFPGEDEIKENCEILDVEIVKVEGGLKAANKYGIDEIPAIIYYEKEIPTIYEGVIHNTEELVEWIETQRTSDTIEEVSDEILQALIVDQEYLAVFFTGPCDENAKIDLECETVLEELENIDDELDNYGITMVTTEDIKYAGHVLKVRKFPALGLFRNGDFLLYEGSLKSEKEMLNWILDKDSLNIPGKIEEVGQTMLKKIVEEESDVVVFIYKDLDRNTEEIIKGLETIDDELSKQNIHFVICSDSKIEEQFGFFKSPILLYFENGIPSEFDGEDLKDEKEIYKWAMEHFETNDIPTVDLPVMEKLIDTMEDLLVIFYDPNKRKHNTFLEDVEGIDDDAEKLDVFMIKNGDPTIAKTFGLFTLPAIIYYEDGIPNVYDDDLTTERVMKWLEECKTGSHIEKVTGPLLEDLIQEEEYVAVLFLSDCDKNEEFCESTIQELETIDDELDELDIHFVYTDDTQYASSKLKISNYPTILYYRNGQKLEFEGTIGNEMAVLKFLTNIDNLLLSNQLEEVGVNMLNYLMRERSHVFAFLYDEDHKRAKKILKKLEEIDDDMEGDSEGSGDESSPIFVKCSDVDVEEEYGVGFLPRLIYFNDRVPAAYDGNEMDSEAVLNWMKNEIIKDEFVSVTRSMMERLIAKEDYIGVIFVDENNKEEMQIVNTLEKSIDNLKEDNLMVVIVDDEEWASQLGLSDPPTLIHFSKDIPSVYSGQENAKDIIYWLDKMRTEHLIEEITVNILEDLIEQEEYIAVIFTGHNCNDEACEEIMESLENVDDDLNDIGISFVKLDDEDYPYRQHEISSFPAVGIYRNGNFMIYNEGPLDDEEEVRKWLMDEEVLNIDGQIEEINEKLLSYLYENDDNLVVFFYSESDRDSDDYIERYELIDERLQNANISFVKICDEDAGEQFGISEIPALVYIQNGIPNIYDDNLEEEEKILEWILEEEKTTRILDVTQILLEKLLEKFMHMAVIFYDMEEDPTVTNLQSIAEQCQEADIAILKINDVDELEKYGLQNRQLPVVVFFDEKIPSLMIDINIEDSDEVFDWIMKQKESTLVEEVTDVILMDLVEKHEYVAVYFRGSCDNAGKADCQQVLAELETIDDELDTTGIMMVTTSDIEVAKDNGVKELPAIGLFRNGHFVVYEGDEDDERAILKWLTDEETLKIIGIIDEVNLAMLENILDEEDDAFVFFYEGNDTDAHTILEELESIDEKLDQQDLAMVKISDPGAAEAFGIEEMPSLVYFENGIPELYEGDLLNDVAVMKWMKIELKQNEIKEVTIKMLDKLIDREKTMAVLFYDPDDSEDHNVLDELERIDDDCEKYEIDFIKVKDREEAKKYGIDDLPGLLYFEKKIPSLYDSDLSDEEELLKWLIEQKMTDTIEQVTEEILEKLIEDEEYLAVFFSGPCESDDPCYKILEDLETLDSVMGHHGIMLVTTEERELAKVYDVKSFPALGLFRNGDYVPYEGDLENSLQILEWITDKKTVQILGKIEEVNSDMLDYILETETDVLVFLYRDGNLQDENIIDELEKIDDDLDEKEIEFVKSSEKYIEKKFGLTGLPLLVHFHNYVPSLYKGEFDDEKEILKWVTLTVDSNEIEQVSGPVLDVLIDQVDNIGVIFYNDDENAEFLENMESLDDDLDNINIPLVKIDDEGKALEFGIDNFPTIVYFKNEIPGLYDGSLEDFQEILNWVSQRKKGSQMQLVSDSILEDLTDKFHYVAVLFAGNCKQEDEDCQSHLDEVIEGIEDINDDVENIGIIFVQTSNRKLAKVELGVAKFPSVGLFRNGKENFVEYKGDISDEAGILSWLSDPDSLEVQNHIEDMNTDMLRHIIESEDDVLVFLYENDDADLEEILQQLEKIDATLENEDIEFIRVDAADEDDLDNGEDVLKEYGLTLLPSLVYFENGIPIVYPGDLRNEDSVLGWITKELREQDIPEVNTLVLESVLDRNEFIAVLYYNKHHALDQTILQSLESIDGELKDNDISFIKINDQKEFKSLGIDYSPVLVYYENGIPNLYPHSDLSDVSDIQEWLVEQRNTASIEHVTDEMINEIIDDNEYVAVLFTGHCSGDDDGTAEEDCLKIKNELEKIDHLLDEYGIVFVQTNDLEKAQEHWISRLPALALYRNGDYVKYNGMDLTNERQVLKWLTAEKTLSIPGQIEKVNDLMLTKKLKDGNEDIFVFFYDENDRVFAERILKGLEELDSQLESQNIDFVKINDDGIDNDYDLEDLPALVHFKNGESSEFYGDFRQNDVVAQWIDEETAEKKKSNKKKLKKNKRK